MSRKAQGLLLAQTVSDNIVLASLRKLCHMGVVDVNLQYFFAKQYVKEIGIKVPSLNAEVRSLSGGNQQKVVLAKWLMTEPKILILDEPTRGIDVGAKYEIYTIMMDLAAKGRPAYFDGPFLTDEEAHGEKGEDGKGDEELLEAEVPALELSAEDLKALAQRKAERGKHGKKQKKHKKKGDSKKGGGHA